MSSPYLGEIRVFAFGFAPSGWQMCNGQTLAISQNAALFSLLGTTYGGNGTSTFQLPNMQSRVCVHQGTGAGLSTYVMGEVTGVENVSLLLNNMPLHTHNVNGVTATSGQVAPPTGAYPATGTSRNGAVEVYSTATPNTTMNANMIVGAGGNVPHNNLQPLLVMNYCIAMVGIFPSRN
jgi:microcystin-dependent protein